MGRQRKHVLLPEGPWRSGEYSIATIGLLRGGGVRLGEEHVNCETGLTGNVSAAWLGFRRA